LGSIRLTTNETGTVVSAQDYFAYGELLREFNSNDRYKYTEKERDTETGYDYFGARYYDTELGRWLAVDPLADSYPKWSPYSYAGNNPLNAVDINGMEWVFIPGYGWVWELPEVVVTASAWWKEVANEKLDKFSAENSSVNEYSPLIPAIRIVVPAFATLSMSILGMLTFSGDTDPHQKRLLMSEETSEQERGYSDHAEERMKEQKISKERVEEVIEKGRTQPGNEAGTTEHYLPGSQSVSGRGIRVVTNSKGDVITVTDKGTSWKGGPIWK
jgi:RHS repeat-associated protein